MGGFRALTRTSNNKRDNRFEGKDEDAPFVPKTLKLVNLTAEEESRKDLKANFKELPTSVKSLEALLSK